MKGVLDVQVCAALQDLGSRNPNPKPKVLKPPCDKAESYRVQGFGFSVWVVLSVWLAYSIVELADLSFGSEKSSFPIFSVVVVQRTSPLSGCSLYFCNAISAVTCSFD